MTPSFYTAPDRRHRYDSNKRSAIGTEWPKASKQCLDCETRPIDPRERKREGGRVSSARRSGGLLCLCLLHEEQLRESHHRSNPHRRHLHESNAQMIDTWACGGGALSRRLNPIQHADFTPSAEKTALARSNRGSKPRLKHAMTPQL